MIEKVRCSFDEQETIVNLPAVQVSDTMSVYTTTPSMISRMWKLYEQYPAEVKIIKDDQYGTEFSVPRDWLKIKPKRKMSEEQRQVLSDRLASYR